MGFYMLKQALKKIAENVLINTPFFGVRFEKILKAYRLSGYPPGHYHSTIPSLEEVWNETYMLRAFLMDNPYYEIILFNSMMQKKHRDWFVNEMPKCLLGEKDTGSIWLRKIDP
jgi:hypothetical protein